MYQKTAIIGYDHNGMPIYGKPDIYQQPQIIGYDQNGMPVYSQPAVYQHTPIVGYDQNGMPVYGQPMIRPQVSGYDQQRLRYDNGQSRVSVPAKPAADEKADITDDFWKFFDGGSAGKHKNISDDDFFGKHSEEMDSLSIEDIDLSRKKKYEEKHSEYMSDAPIADASALVRNEEHKFNRLYMRSADIVNADDLEYNTEKKTQDKMRAAREVSAESLAKNSEALRWNIMAKTKVADADQLEQYIPEHKQAIMAQADRAVEAIPKRNSSCNDKEDHIMLRKHIQDKKAAETEAVEIPVIPELKDLFSKG